jgi:hypothetical protein
MDMKTQMAGVTADAASHLALLKLLLKRGVINDTDLDIYLKLRVEAAEHIATISSIVSMAVLINEKDASEEEVREILDEMGIELAGIEERCRKALSYLVMTDEQREQINIIVDALPFLKDAVD